MGIALITGATAGIGYELAKCFAKDGHDLILVARTESRLDAVAHELSDAFDIDVTIIPADLSDPEMPEAVYDTAAEDGTYVDYLVNNAGFGINGGFATTDLRTELDIIQVNAASVVSLTKLFLQDMLAGEGGGIMNVSSIGAFQPVPYLNVYCASKAFVQSFTEALAYEMRRTNVHVMALCPGITSTEFIERAEVGDNPLMRAGLVPMQTAEAVAREGYKAFMAKKKVVVTGLMNKIAVQYSRLTPSRIKTAVTGRFMSK
jgi:hypothetical protein